MFLGFSASAQDPIVITDRDMFTKVGEYYRAYLNVGSESTFAEGSQESLIKEPGGPHFWDFTDGPTAKSLRYEIVPANEENHNQAFPDATFAERETNEATDEQKWQFMRQVPGVGRQVYGRFDPSATPSALVFDNPSVDFPDQIKYGDSWAPKIVSWEQTFFQLGLEIPARLQQSVTMTADAYGIIELPGIGFGDALRINEVTTLKVFSDVLTPGSEELLLELSVRTYYWIRRDHGIVALMTSGEVADGEPDLLFDPATQFLRMFETNKKPVPPCAQPNPVTDLRISFSGGRALLKWTKADCASSYGVQYTDTPRDPDSWIALGGSQNDFYLDLNLEKAPIRFYRLLSLTPEDEVIFFPSLSNFE